MNHTDFSRAFIMAARQVTPHQEVAAVIDKLKAAQKFILPEDGILLDDKDLKGINEQLKLSLPFPITVLEFNGSGHFKKNIIVLRQLDADIELTPLVFDDRTKKWGFQGPVFIDRHRAIERRPGDAVAYFIRYSNQADMEFGVKTKTYDSFVYKFLSFINVLACSNVAYERSAPGAVRQARRTPIPYDSYHVLTIGSSRKSNRDGSSQAGMLHASPREHLRRGCIVRAKSGKAHWRNSTIVMAGTEGKVTKSYRLAA